MDCVTEHKTTIATDGDHNQIYRAHPAYRGRRPWNNWVYVQYLIHRKDARGRVTKVFEDHLSKIILFVDFTKSLLPNMTDIEGYVSPGTYALVQTLEAQPVPVRNSVILSTCILSHDFYLVPTSSFRKPAFVVDNVGCENRSLFIVPPTDEWAEFFI